MRQQEVTCYHCGEALEVNPRAFSINCPNCNQRINLENYEITQPRQIFRIESSGGMAIRKTGQLRSSLVRVQELLLEGSLEGGAVIVRNKATLRAGCRLQADITAERMELELGARLTGFCRIGPAE